MSDDENNIQCFLLNFIKSKNIFFNLTPNLKPFKIKMKDIKIPEKKKNEQKKKTKKRVVFFIAIMVFWSGKKDFTSYKKENAFKIKNHFLSF